MRIPRLHKYIGLCALFAVLIGCNRRTYQAHEYQAPLNTPAPVPEGEYSDPAAATPERVAPVNQDRKLPDDSSAAHNSLPGNYFHCPPPGTTPPSATVTGKGSPLAAVDCPPGDPNASTSQLGLPGTPGSTGVGAKNEEGSLPPPDRENNIGP